MEGDILSNQAARQQLAKISGTNAEDWFLCLKQRFGLAEVLKAIKAEQDAGEILTIPYTCITAINPIVVAGHKPIYADIDPTTLSISENSTSKITAKTKAVILQHTLGIIANHEKIIKAAQKHKALIVEDSAHALLRFMKDSQDQIIADISAHSFGVEKILPGTKFGGAIYVSPRLKTTHPKLHETIVKYLTTLPQPSKSLSFRVKHYRFNNAILQRTPAGIRPTLRNLAIKTKILEPAVYPFEQQGQQSDSIATNEFVNQTIISNLKTLNQNYARRLASVKFYHKNLKSSEFVPVTKENQPLLAYPITFKEIAKTNQAYDILMSSGYFIRRWYSPLLYPGPTDNHLYHFDPRKTPISEEVSARTISLPTDLPNTELSKIVKLLQKP